jgi:hypothetical protein
LSFKNRDEENRRKEGTGIWRNLHIRSIMICADPLFIAVIRSRRLRRIGHVSYMREITNTYRFLSGIWWKVPLKRPECRWKNNMYFLKEDSMKMWIEFS